MFESRTERRGFPGGLRTQLLLALVVLVVGTMALVALVGVHLAKQQVQRSELERTAEAARQIARLRQFAPPDQLMATDNQPGDVDYAHLRVGDDAAGYGDLPADAALDQIDDVLEKSDASPAVGITRIEGRPYAVASLDGGDGESAWRAVVARSLAGAYDRLDRSRQLLLAYLGIDALFILIVAYAFLTYVVVRPIRAIGVATERAARGDLASHIEILPPNEFGQVGRSFNRMLDELRENRRELRERLDELDEAYRELEQTQESLIRSEKMASVGQLAAGVAHEIGNPLSAVTGYLEFLDDPDLDPEKRADIVARMENQVDRIQSIIRDLLDYSRDEADQAIEPVALAPCVDEAIDLLQPQPRARDVEVERDLPDDLPKIRGNSDQLVQVLINLLINAADALDGEDDESGTIEVSAVTDETSVRLRVTDDGPGIADEDLNRIFDPFFTTKDPGDGTGLGLAIAHRIMDRFDGDIEVESEPGEGAQFTLTFQRADSE